MKVVHLDSIRLQAKHLKSVVRVILNAIVIHRERSVRSLKLGHEKLLDTYFPEVGDALTTAKISHQLDGINEKIRTYFGTSVIVSIDVIEDKIGSTLLGALFSVKPASVILEEYVLPVNISRDLLLKGENIQALVNEKIKRILEHVQSDGTDLVLTSASLRFEVHVKLN